MYINDILGSTENLKNVKPKIDALINGEMDRSTAIMFLSDLIGDVRSKAYSEGKDIGYEQGRDADSFDS
jgi:hypothetical protein